jgi:hypothetical protein
MYIHHADTSITSLSIEGAPQLRTLVGFLLQQLSSKVLSEHLALHPRKHHFIGFTVSQQRAVLSHCRAREARAPPAAARPFMLKTQNVFHGLISYPSLHHCRQPLPHSLAIRHTHPS